MIVELVSVGTELLLGNIVNTNTQYLAEQCALLGLSLYHQSVVGDNHDRLAEVVKTALGRSDVVILTGGLGPTEDDLTKEVLLQRLWDINWWRILIQESIWSSFSRTISIKKFRTTTGSRPWCRRELWFWTITMAWHRD